MRQRLIVSVAIGWLGLACVASAQTSPDNTVIPPATSISSPGGTWTMSGGCALLDGVSTNGCNINSVTWLGGSIYIHDASLNGQYYRYDLSVSYLWVAVGQTLPNLPPAPPAPHFCDTPAPNPQPITAGLHQFAACWSKTDVSGLGAIATGWSGTINGVSQSLTMAQATGPASSRGLYEFDSQSVNFPAGTYPVSVTVTTSGGSATNPMTQTVTAGTVQAVPSSPTNPFVR